MKKLFYLLVILSVALGLAACGTEQAADISSDTSTAVSSSKVTAESIISNMEGADYKEGELLVKFKSGVATSSSLKMHQALGASVKGKFKIVPNLEHVVLPEGVSVKDAISQYMADPSVEYAEPNYIRKASQGLPATIPNDDYFGQQWALENRGLFNGTPGADIMAPEAWVYTLGWKGNITVAVLDSGIDYNHADLVGNIWTNTGEICPNGIDDDLNWFVDDCIGWDFNTCEEYDITIDYDAVCAIVKTEDNDPWDDNDHGTHVAGIIGAVGNNNMGIAGVIWNVKLMAVKFLNKQGIGTVAEEVRAINYAVDNRAHIINASYGSSDFSQAESDAVAYANSNGVLFVAAAGNSGTNNDVDPEYPASLSLLFHNVTSVAATDQNDRRAPFSNYGKNSVHVGAPGVYILSTVPGNHYVGTNQELFMGTSQAAPHVSGLTALLLEQYTHFTPYQIRGTIIRYSDPLPTLTDWIYGVEPSSFTAGRINAYRAVTSLLTPDTLSATTNSTSQIYLAWLDHATGEDGYKVERRLAGGAFSQITNPPLGPGAIAYTDGGLIDGTTYFYRVRAYNFVPDPPNVLWIETNSAYSNEASATTLLSPPTGLTATAVSSSQINLAWTDNSQAEDGYAIERGQSDFVLVGTVGPNQTTYVNSGLTPETEYKYRVRAYNAAAGNSTFSNVATATTLTPGGTPPPAPPTSSSSSCSIGARQNSPSAIANLMVLLIPVLYMVYLRRRK